MADEWGPWIEHDGQGQPVANGVLVSVSFRIEPSKDAFIFGNPHCDFAENWVWHHDGTGDDITRYRVRKPRGLTILQQLVADPPPLVETDEPAPVAAG